MNKVNNEIEKPVYFLIGEEYNGAMPSYFDVSQFDFVQIVEENWEMIRDEMLGTVSPENFPVPNYNPNLVSEAKVWRNICFYNYLWTKHKNIVQFPKTAAFLNQIPDLTYAAMNMLEPGAKIFPHRGDTNTTVRFHLGIAIPAGLPDCGIKVNGEDKGWEEGKMIAFSDAHLHSVWNNTPHYRFVFVIDIMQKEYRHDKMKICSGVLATLTLKSYYYKLNTSKLPPLLFIHILHSVVSFFWRIYLPLQRAFQFLP